MDIRLAAKDWLRRKRSVDQAWATHGRVEKMINAFSRLDVSHLHSDRCLGFCTAFHSIPARVIPSRAVARLRGLGMLAIVLASYVFCLTTPRDVCGQGILQTLLGTGKTASIQEQPDVGILLFSQNACPPCKQIEPMIDHLINQGFPIQKVDVAATPGIAQQWSVSSTPTMVVLAEGKEVSRHSGIVTAHQVGKMLIDAGYDADLSVLTKPSATTPLRTMLDRIRPGRRGHRQTNDPTASIASDQWTAAEAAAMAASVRIKVHYHEDGSRITDFGTGTVIHRQGDDILILTCGHVFRDSQGDAEIEIDFGFDGGESRFTVPARLLMFDAGAPDVAIVSASTSQPIEPVEIAESDYVPRPNTRVFSVGCDHGQPATIRRGEYLSTSLCGEAVSTGQQPQGPPARKYDISGRPVVGRSGGGLFTEEGQLIGVCNAAVIHENQGVYSSVVNVHHLLNKSNLAVLFQQPSGVSLANFEAQVQEAQIQSASLSASSGEIQSRQASTGSQPAKNRFFPALDDSELETASTGTPDSLPGIPSGMVTVMIPDADSPAGYRTVQLPATRELLSQLNEAKLRQSTAADTHRLPSSSGATMRGQSRR